MENTINIQITCSINIHNEIEEYCINNGMTLSKYFLSLHEDFKDRTNTFFCVESFREMAEEGKIELLPAEVKPINSKGKKK